MLGPYGKVLSGLYLAYSFGIAPLVSDMKKVHKALDTVRDQVKKARASEGKVVSIHRSDTGRVSYRTTLGVDLGSSMDSGFWRWRLVSNTSTRVCTVRGYRRQKYISEELSRLDYLLGRFGATGPTTLIKELIPFSFVVEWFVDLRNITDRLDNLLTGQTKKILDVCVSEKYDTTSFGLFNPQGNYASGGSSPSQDTGKLLYTEREKYYHRVPVTNYNIVGWSGKFGKKQASLLGALLHQLVANLLVKR
jgi:hypothetical protein